MTTIAFDGNVLAVDRAAWAGNTHYLVTKLHRIDGQQHGWYAMAGHAGRCQKVKRWLTTGERFDVPAEEQEKSFGMFVDDDARAYEVNGALELCLRENVPVADGGGHQVALGAMLAGATAVQAIKIAEKCSDLARGCNWIPIGPGYATAPPYLEPG